MVRAMCEVQLKDRKRHTDLIFMLDVNETIDQLAMANSVHWCGHVLRREDVHILKRVKVKGRKGRYRGKKKSG